MNEPTQNNQDNVYVIETDSLTKVYGNKKAVNNVSVHIRRGDIYGLIGKNGAGKTTLMRLILGLTSPTSGKIYINSSTALYAEREKIGSIIEAPGLYKSCSAYENLLRFSILYGADKDEIPSILSLVGLENVGKKKAGVFSQGMRQRLGIAIALLAHPDILILDEPINGLDPAGIKEIRDLLLKLNEEKKVTIMISSHLLDELAKIVTVYGIIRKGELVEEISAEELEARCGFYAKFVTSDDDKAASIIVSAYPDASVEKRADGLYMFNDLEKTAAINALLVKSGLDVSEIAKISYGLEDFFIERLGD